MSISITNINNNWKLLSTGNKYYEEELFTKFEDAFLYECNGRNNGINIIHHARSYVQCIEFSTVLRCTGGVTAPYCELADIRFLAYSLKRNTARLLFLQFKEAKQNTIGYYADINEKQMLLFSEFPMVSYYGQGPDLHDVLQDTIHNCPQSGAMFAMIEYDSASKEYNLRFMNHTMLNPQYPRLTRSKSGYHYYDHLLPTSTTTVPATASSPAFTYCDYVSTFEEFLYRVKRLEVGREIDIADLFEHISEEELPEDLIEYCKNNNNIDNIVTDNVKDYKSGKSVHLVDTLALNVDELV